MGDADAEPARQHAEVRRGDPATRFEDSTGLGRRELGPEGHDLGTDLRSRSPQETPRGHRFGVGALSARRTAKSSERTSVLMERHAGRERDGRPRISGTALRRTSRKLRALGGDDLAVPGALRASVDRAHLSARGEPIGTFGRRSELGPAGEDTRPGGALERRLRLDALVEASGGVLAGPLRGGALEILSLRGGGRAFEEVPRRGARVLRRRGLDATTGRLALEFGDERVRVLEVVRTTDPRRGEIADMASTQHHRSSVPLARTVAAPKRKPC